MEKITSRKNPLAMHVKKLGVSREYRKECGEFLCDGIKLLEEAVKSGAEIIAVLTASNVPFPLPLETRVFYSDRSLIDSLSPLKNAQDTLFTCRVRSIEYMENSEFRIPSSELSYTASVSSGAHILLDGIQDPGNVGAIIRTANALGIRNVLLTNGCADPYNPKTIRASMGAIFRQRFYSMSFSELSKLKEKNVRFIGAVSDDGCKDISSINMSSSIVAIGSEGSGLSDEVLSLCDELLTIPISPKSESLNASVAAAIIMWEAHRSRAEDRG